MLILEFQSLSGNLLFGFLPESATVLLFGACLVASTIGIRRWFLKRHEQENVKKQMHETLENRGN